MELVKRIEAAIEKLNKIVSNNSKGKLERMNISISQIKIIIDELEHMKKYINHKEFVPTYTHVILDSWDTNEEQELSNELIKIKKIYCRIKRKSQKGGR